MKKNISITIGITSFLIALIVFLIYVIYCFSYYENSLKKELINNYNLYKYDYIYANTHNSEAISKKDYHYTMNLMNDKNTLIDIYNNYYKEKNIYEDINDFVNKYYFGDYQISKKDITFYKEGKTNLLDRSTIYFDKVNIKSKNGLESTYGVFNNIKFIIDQSSNLYIDDVKQECNFEACTIETMLGGIHKLQLESNSYKYFTLVNVTDSNTEIEVLLLDDLVAVNKVIEKAESNNEFTLEPGRYNLKEVYFDYSKPSLSKSYLDINEDGTVLYHTYISTEIASEDYRGTYSRKGDFLTFDFTSHLYAMYDYDTHQSSNVETTVNTKMSFKIIDNNEIKNDKLHFKR